MSRRDCRACASRRPFCRSAEAAALGELLRLAPPAGRGRREAPGEGNIHASPVHLTPTLSPQAGREGTSYAGEDKKARNLARLPELTYRNEPCASGRDLSLRQSQGRLS